MSSAEKMDVSFTKIGNDVVVPTWRTQGGNGESFKNVSFIWWGMMPLWFLGVYVFVKDGIQLLGIAFVTIFVVLLGISFHLVMKIPQKWIEFNRKDGFISVWTSRKKRKRIGRWHIDQVDITMNRRWISSGPRGQTSENRYLIELFDTNPLMKNTPFLKFDNHPQTRGVPFFVLFDLFGDPHSDPEDSDFAIATAMSLQVEKFIRDFLSGKPVSDSSTSIYTFSVPD
jgi:hypothetical protein